MAIAFKKAVRTGALIRSLLIGQSGAGKTYTALALACHMAEAIGSRVAVVDTEDNSAAKYAGERCGCCRCMGQGITFDFDVLCLTKCSPNDYLQAMAAASGAGYRILVLDSITHEWDGPGGCLEMVDANQQRSKNKHAAWGPVTEEHNRFLQAIRSWPGHVVATVRAKEKHEKQGNQVVSLGVLPIQRDGIEYEFDFAVFLNGASASVCKTRASSLRGWVGRNPGADLAADLLAWSGTGEPASATKPAPAPKRVEPRQQPQRRPEPPRPPVEVLDAEPELEPEDDLEVIDAALEHAMSLASQLHDAGKREQAISHLRAADSLDRLEKLTARVQELLTAQEDATLEVEAGPFGSEPEPAPKSKAKAGAPKAKPWAAAKAELDAEGPVAPEGL